MTISLESGPFGSRDNKVSPYERIRDAILDGTLPPSFALVESQLAEWCGVSRTPVREALTRLEQDGLVQRGDRGLVVRDRSPEEILDIYGVRVTLEVAAAREAARRHSDFDKVRLERLLKAWEEADPSNGQDMASRNRNFHQGIWRAGHNDALMDLLTRLNMHLGRYPATTLSSPGRWSQASEQHRELVAAIVARDGDRAGDVARVHFEQARDIRLALWESQMY